MPARRPKLTYANVVSTLALFLALGGGAVWAAGKLGSGDIKRNAIRSKHVKPNAVKGSDVAEFSLGQVPTAFNADRLDGLDSSELRASCPAGTSPFAGVCIETAPREQLSYTAANAVCAALGRRLPTFPELDAFRLSPAGQLSGFEWIGDHDTDTAGGGQFGAVVLAISDSGATEAHDIAGSVPDPYRCVTGPTG